MPGTLFISDLDGTLLDDRALISDASVQMLNKAISLGAMVSIATARTPSTVESLISHTNISLPLIVMTGSAVWNPVNGEFIRKVKIPEPVARQVLDIFMKHRLPVFVYTLPENKIHVYHYGPFSPLEEKFIEERAYSNYKIIHRDRFGNPVFPESLEDVMLFYAMQPYGQVVETYEEIAGTVDCYPLCYHDIFGEATGLLEVFSANTSKAKALDWLRHYLNIDRVIAFGDNINDIPLLKAANVSVAVENARPEVKEVADIVIGPNTADSVASFILHSTLDNRKFFF